MVVQGSDSYSTLVSLQGGLKQVAADPNTNQCSLEEESSSFVRTELYLPLEEDGDFDDFEDDVDFSLSKTRGTQQSLPEQPLYLPKRLDTSVDQFLRHVPELIERCDELLANEPRHFTEESPEKVLYIAQGEMGHAIPIQCDVIMSDKATTCHILACRSESNDALPLSSLAHIDGCRYEQSIRSMILEHIQHHKSKRYWEEMKYDNYSNSAEVDGDDRVHLDIHILGGFDDEDSVSTKISSWLISLLATIALEERDSIKMTLKTCAISSINDDGRMSPIGRGLALSTLTGEVFLARADHQVTGPLPDLRSVRLFSKPHMQELSLVHSATSNDLKIEPFLFEPFEELPLLLSLPDEIMLQHCSTSPNVEEEDFCPLLRSSFRYLLDQDCTHVFGPSIDQPVVHRRCGSTNRWKRVI
jgi:hypothetical protein